LLQPKLNLKVSQRQVLTPGLVQMVSVLALNKLELKEMINAEIVENPVLEEIEESCVTIEERAGREAELERPAEEAAKTEKDPFDEIDFGSYFQDYLDPGFRTSSTFEDIERPSFDNFLSQPSTLSDHLIWQLGAMKLTERVRLAAELIIGNLNGDGYLIATDEELAYALKEALGPELAELIPFERGVRSEQIWKTLNGGAETSRETPDAAELALREKQRALLETVAEARHIINRLDPIGVGARDLRECLLIQIRERKREAELVLRRGGRAVAVEIGGDGNVQLAR